MRNCITIIIMCFGFVLCGQTEADLKIQIIDDVSNEPISYATLRIKGTNQGLIADYEGELRLPYKLIKEDITLLITSIGFQSKEVAISDLKRNQLNIIRLKIQVEALDPIVIKSKKISSLKELEDEVKELTASEIVQKAIDSITVRLDKKAHSYVGYYRDYQIVDDTYYNLNEAILETFDQGIITKKLNHPKNKSALHFFGTNKDFLIDSTLSVPYRSSEKYIQGAEIQANGGNELTILNVHNPIRNFNIRTFSFANNFRQDFLDGHKVTKGDLSFFDNVPIIKIPFTLKKSITNGRYKVKGDMYISLDDFAIYRFNYNCFEGNNTDPIFSISIEYKEQNQKMYLNYITFNNRFAMVDKNTLREEDIVFNTKKDEFTITFNKPIDIASVRRGCFKIKYKGTKLIIDSFKVVSETKVRVKVFPFTRLEGEQRKMETKDMFMKIKRIKDLNGKRLYERQDLQGYQFRELFVQEVFLNNNIPSEILLINSKKPLGDSQINTNLDYDRYWINSPLKSKRSH